MHEKAFKKKVIYSFSEKFGCVRTVTPKNKKIVNANWYTAVYLLKIITELRKISQ